MIDLEAYVKEFTGVTSHQRWRHLWHGGARGVLEVPLLTEKSEPYRNVTEYKESVVRKLLRAKAQYSKPPITVHQIALWGFKS